MGVIDAADEVLDSVASELPEEPLLAVALVAALVALAIGG
jgi:hypothetical protein